MCYSCGQRTRRRTTNYPRMGNTQIRSKSRIKKKRKVPAVFTTRTLSSARHLSSWDMSKKRHLAQKSGSPPARFYRSGGMMCPTATIPSPKRSDTRSCGVTLKTSLDVAARYVNKLSRQKRHCPPRCHCTTSPRDLPERRKQHTLRLRRAIRIVTSLEVRIRHAPCV